jgi:hypothetical protein
MGCQAIRMLLAVFPCVGSCLEIDFVEQLETDSNIEG